MCLDLHPKRNGFNGQQGHFLMHDIFLPKIVLLMAIQSILFWVECLMLVLLRVSESQIESVVCKAGSLLMALSFWLASGHSF